MHRFGWSLAAAALCLAAPFAAVPSAADSVKDHFTATDANRDGTVERNEYRRRMVDVFYLADDNKDGIVVIEELREQETVGPDAFAAADKNGDGKLSMQEFIEYRMVDFQKADSNGDGKLTVEEVDVWNAR